MDKLIQNQICESFIAVVSSSPLFTREESNSVNKAISSSQKAEKIADAVLQAIGGAEHENY